MSSNKNRLHARFEQMASAEAVLKLDRSLNDFEAGRVHDFEQTAAKLKAKRFYKKGG